MKKKDNMEKEIKGNTKKKVFKIDQNLIDRKSMEVCRIFDGMTIPEVFAVTGSVLVDLVGVSAKQGYDVRSMASEWLTSISSIIEKMEIELEEDSSFKAN